MQIQMLQINAVHGQTVLSVAAPAPVTFRPLPRAHSTANTVP